LAVSSSAIPERLLPAPVAFAPPGGFWPELAFWPTWGRFGATALGSSRWMAFQIRGDAAAGL